MLSDCKKMPTAEEAHDVFSNRPTSTPPSPPHDQFSPPVTPAPLAPDLPITAPRRCLSIVPEEKEEEKRVSLREYQDEKEDMAIPVASPRKCHMKTPSTVSVEATPLPVSNGAASAVESTHRRGVFSRLSNWVRHRFPRRHETTKEENEEANGQPKAQQEKPQENGQEKE